MVSAVQITMRAEPSVKASFEAICKEIGISVNAALNIFVKRVIRDRKIPFEVAADPFYSEANMRHLRQSIQELQEGKVAEHELIED